MRYNYGIDMDSELKRYMGDAKKLWRLKEIYKAKKELSKKIRQLGQETSNILN